MKDLIELIKDVWDFLKIRKKYWLGPLIISLIAASLVIEPRSKYLSKFHKLNIFLVGISVIILSQLALKFFLSSINILYLILCLPVILVVIYYIVLLIFTKFKLSYL